MLIESGKMGAGGDGSEEGKVVRAWLWEHLGAYGDLLAGLMQDVDTGLRVRSLVSTSLCRYSINY